MRNPRAVLVLEGGLLMIEAIEMIGYDHFVIIIIFYIKCVIDDLI